MFPGSARVADVKSATRSIQSSAKFRTHLLLDDDENHVSILSGLMRTLLSLRRLSTPSKRDAYSSQCHEDTATAERRTLLHSSRVIDS